MPLAADLPLRAVLSGAAIGSVLAVCNTYMGLRIGWFDTGSLTAALLGFGLLKALRLPPTPHQHNALQTLASAVATTPSTIGLLAAVPALASVGVQPSLWALVVWGTALSLWGVLLALPLRKRLLEVEQLPFPTGIATAELIQSVQASAPSSRGRVRVFLAALGLAAAVTWLRDGRPQWLSPELGVEVLAGAAVLGLSISPMGIGAGVMTGARVSISLFFGALAARLLLAPWLVRSGLAVPEAAGDWLVWPGVGLMLGASVPAVVTAVREAPAALRGTSVAFGRAAPIAAAACIAAALGVGLHWGLSPVSLLIGFALSVPLVAVSTRAAGQTDIAPLAPIGQLTQVVAGLLGPGAASTLGAGAVPAGAGAQTANTFWTLKAGRILGAADGPQLVAQATGAALGALVSSATYLILVSRFTPGSEALPAPWLAPWKALAILLAGGGTGLPPGAATALAVSGALGLALVALESRAPRLAPSALALGLACLLPLTATATLALGGVIAWAMVRRQPGSLESVGLPLAAGAIAGESLVALLCIALGALGVFG